MEASSWGLLTSRLVDRSPSNPPAWRWGTVESVDPLRILMAGDVEPLPYAPDCVGGPLAVGDLVRVVFVGNRPLVLGAVNQRPPNTVIIEGTAYWGSGSWGVSVSSWALTGDPYGSTLQLVPPFTPPEGYWFETFTLTSSGYTVCHTSNTPAPGGAVPDRVNVRVIQHGSNSLTALSRVGWRLTRIT